MINDILEIVKSKYKDVESFDEFTIVFNKNIAPYHDGCKRISYSRLEEADDGLCITEVILQPYDSFKKKEDPIFKEIELKNYLNNNIELKLYLGIDLHFEDIVPNNTKVRTIDISGFKRDYFSFNGLTFCNDGFVFKYGGKLIFIDTTFKRQYNIIKELNSNSENTRD